MKKVLSLIVAAVMLAASIPAAAEGETVAFDGLVYSIVGENLFKCPDFTSGGERCADQWYVGANTATSWDAKAPNPVTKENLTPLGDVVMESEGAANGKNAFYYSSGGSLSATGSNYFLCEYITGAAGSYWNGNRALQAYVPIEGGKSYYFSYYVSSWGNVANSSVRYGAINSQNFCQSAADGKIIWSGTGGVNVDHYDGNNMNQRGSWTKKEAVITAGEDADYFFFNLYWLQDTNFVCLNGFTLKEVESAQIDSFDSINVSCKAGSTPLLPSYIGVTYTNAAVGRAKVEWDNIQFDRDGEHTVNGIAYHGADTYFVTAAVTVYSDSSDPRYSISKDIYLKDGVVTAEVRVFTDEASPLMAALALFDGEGGLSRVCADRLNPSGSDELVLSVPAPIYDGYAAKVFVWDADSLLPLTGGAAEKIEIEEGGAFMPLSEVTLLEGMFKTAQELNEDYLLNIDPDRLLAPCFDSAGLTPKAEAYGGWEGKYYNNPGGLGISGHSLGHWMSAVSTMYLASGNEELKNRLDYAVSELGRIQETTGSGYIGGLYETPFTQAFNGQLNVGGFSLNNAWVPWYSVHKIYQGLIDAYVNVGNKQALDVVKKFADWALEGTSRMTDDQMQRMLDCEHGGMNDVFAQLYDITGNESYLTMAVRFTHDRIIAPLANGTDQLTGQHANTQIPKVIGAAEIYEQSGERSDYRAASEFFWDTVVNRRSYAIGGNSIREHFEAEGAETLHEKNCESCNTYNMIKLSEHLFAWEHDSKYMDYVENALYNDILGAQDPDSGNKMYFTSLLQGHFRIYGTPEDSWWCCTGSGMENPGRYAKCIYYKDRSDLYVNLYIPSLFKWQETGLSVKTETDFPYSDKVKITVLEGSACAALKLRAPSWLAENMTVSIGEESFTHAGGGYLTLERNWKAGDEIEITLPMALNVYTARDSESKVAFKYGPIVLGAPLGTQQGSVTLPRDTRASETDIPTTTVAVPSIVTESTDPADFIAVKDISALTFAIDGQYTSNGAEITLVPFYSIHHQFHNVYWYLNTQADPYVKALNDITIDNVSPDGQQDEIGHKQKGHNSNQGTVQEGINTYFYRDAFGSADAYFSYELTVEPSAENYLYVAYWGADGPFRGYTRSFDIFVDDVKIADQIITDMGERKTYGVFYDIPRELTEGKSTVTVKFAVQSDKTCAGGVFNVRTTRKNTVEV